MTDFTAALESISHLVYECQFCPRAFDSRRGLSMHERICSRLCKFDGCNERVIQVDRCHSHFQAFLAYRAWDFQRSEEWFYERLIKYPICEICIRVGAARSWTWKGSRGHGEIDEGLAVDHCHDTGLIRGVLCRVCNCLLEALDDSVERVYTLIDYLENPPLKNIQKSKIVREQGICKFCNKDLGHFRGMASHLRHCDSRRAYSVIPCSFTDCERSVKPKSGGLCQECARIWGTAKKYQLSFEMSKSLHELTNCQACAREFLPGRGGHNEYGAFDHNHTTGELRGRICGKCNLALGRAHDDAQRLLSAADYLERHKEPYEDLVWDW